MARDLDIVGGIGKAHHHSPDDRGGRGRRGDAMNRLNAVEGKTSSRSSEPFRAGSGPRFLSFEHVCAVVNEPEPSFSISNFTIEPI